MMQELNYICCGDYYIPDIRLPEETRPIGRWGRMHRDYIMVELECLFILKYNDSTPDDDIDDADEDYLF